MLTAPSTNVLIYFPCDQDNLKAECDSLMQENEELKQQLSTLE